VTRRARSIVIVEHSPDDQLQTVHVYRARRTRLQGDRYWCCDGMIAHTFSGLLTLIAEVHKLRGYTEVRVYDSRGALVVR
jgi:hypothetical protein